MLGKPPWRTSACGTCTCQGVSAEEFVAMCERRDTTLSAPNLLLPSIQVNIRAGRLPAAESSGVRYLKVPIRLAT